MFTDTQVHTFTYMQIHTHTLQKILKYIFKTHNVTFLFRKHVLDINGILTQYQTLQPYNISIHFKYSYNIKDIFAHQEVQTETLY